MHALVEAVRDAPASESETDALEWKRELDLTAKAGLATIAKGVLGFANRNPATATRSFDGCAYFLAGVSPKRLDGVQYVDGARLEAGVRVYAGAEPEWRADYVEVDGKNVLVVSVEPPRAGDELRPAMKAHHPEKGGSGPALQAGAILVRHGASTDPATPADIAMLSKRAAARTGERLDVTAELAADDGLKRVDVSEGALDRVIASERRRLEFPLSTTGKALHGQPSVARALSGEHRSERQYRKEVEAYLRKLREHLPERILARAVLHEVATVRLLLRNNTDRTFAGVRLRIRVPESLAVCEWKPRIKDVARLPNAPTPFGQTSPSPYGAGLYHMPSIATIGHEIRGLWVPSVVWDEAAADTVVSFADEEVRAHDVEELPVLYVVAQKNAPSEVEVQWEATARSARGRLAGTVTIPIGGEVVDASDLLDAIPEDAGAA